MPSFSSEPKAMYSANAQSTVRFLVMSARPRKMRERPVREKGTRGTVPEDCSTSTLGWVLNEKAKAVGGLLRTLLPTCSHTRADQAVMYWVRVLSDNPMED